MYTKFQSVNPKEWLLGDTGVYVKIILKGALKEIDCDVDWIQLAHSEVYWRALVNCNYPFQVHVNLRCVSYPVFKCINRWQKRYHVMQYCSPWLINDVHTRNCLPSSITSNSLNLRWARGSSVCCRKGSGSQLLSISDEPPLASLMATSRSGLFSAHPDK
jgi:hypothetical protein